MAIIPTRTSADTASSADANELSTEALDKGGTSQLSALAAETSPGVTDLFLMERASDGALRKVSQANLTTKQITIELQLDAYVKVKIAGLLMGIAGTFVSARAYADTAPVGADIEIDINKNGVSVLTSVLTIADGANSGTTTAFGTTTFAAGDRITFDIDQIGSGTAGGDSLYITVLFK